MTMKTRMYFSSGRLVQAVIRIGLHVGGSMIRAINGDIGNTCRSKYEQFLLVMYSEDVTILYGASTLNCPYIPYKHYPKFNLNNLTSDECLVMFQFEKDDCRLANATQIPEKIGFPN